LLKSYEGSLKNYSRLQKKCTLKTVVLLAACGGTAAVSAKKAAEKHLKDTGIGSLHLLS
jgi:hypothetical protein